MILFESFLKRIEDAHFVGRFFSAFLNKAVLLLFVVVIFSFDRLHLGFNRSVINIFNPILVRIGSPIGYVANYISFFARFASDFGGLRASLENVSRLEILNAEMQKELYELRGTAGSLTQDKTSVFDTHVARVAFYEGLGSKYLWAFLVGNSLPPPIAGSLVKGRHGLVGKVVRTLQDTSGRFVQVQLVTNPRFAIAARRVDMNSYMILKGNNSGSAVIAHNLTEPLQQLNIVSKARAQLINYLAFGIGEPISPTICKELGCVNQHCGYTSSSSGPEPEGQAQADCVSGNCIGEASSSAQVQLAQNDKAIGEQEVAVADANSANLKQTFVGNTFIKERFTSGSSLNGKAKNMDGDGAFVKKLVPLFTASIGTINIPEVPIGFLYFDTASRSALNGKGDKVAKLKKLNGEERNNSGVIILAENVYTLDYVTIYSPKSRQMFNVG